MSRKRQQKSSSGQQDNLREAVKKYFTTIVKPVSTREIAAAVEIPRKQGRILRTILRDLERTGEIYRVGRVWAPHPGSEPFHATVRRSGRGRVSLQPHNGEGWEYSLRLLDARMLFDGDEVSARFADYRSDKRPLAEVVEVLHRRYRTVVGTAQRSGSIWLLHPIDERVFRPFPVSPMLGIKDGEIAVAEIVEYPERDREIRADVFRLIGSMEDEGNDFELIRVLHDLPGSFPPEVMTEVLSFPADPGSDDLAGRCNLSDEIIFTIDPAGARDHDDAVSWKSLADGSMEVGVHIADVSQYVCPGTAIDEEAEKRGTSVYLPEKAIHMLPEELSSGLCSLLPEHERTAISVIYHMRSDSTVISFKIIESVIRSCAKLTYLQAQEILDGQEPDYVPGKLIPVIRALGEVSEKLRKRRIEEGSLDFDLPAPKLLLNEHGMVEGIERKHQTPANFLVEELMLLANESVAKFIVDAKRNSLHRVHEPPDMMKLQELSHFMAALGFHLPSKGKPKPGMFCDFLAEINQDPRREILYYLLLRSMKIAAYSPQNKGHFALGKIYYTHFTSPIRRYPDLLVHRVLKSILRQQKPFEIDWSLIASTTSDLERRAESAERDAFQLKRVRLMQKHVGDTFDGMITSVTSFGLFINLTDQFVEGMIHISELGDDYYEFVEDKLMLIGRRKGRTFELGDKISVKIARADVTQRQIDFHLADTPPSKPSSRLASKRYSRSSRKASRRPESGSDSSRNAASERRSSSPPWRSSRRSRRKR